MAGTTRRFTPSIPSALKACSLFSRLLPAPPRFCCWVAFILLSLAASTDVFLFRVAKNSIQCQDKRDRFTLYLPPLTGCSTCLPLRGLSTPDLCGLEDDIRSDVIIAIGPVRVHFYPERRLRFPNAYRIDSHRIKFSCCRTPPCAQASLPPFMSEAPANPSRCAGAAAPAVVTGRLD